MDGTKRSNIRIGATVMVVQKQDQRTGKPTEGIVKKILTNLPEHHHGMLDSGSRFRLHPHHGDRYLTI